MTEATSAAKAWNDSVIEQFRAGKERIVDRFDRSSLLLLHTKGARTGEPRMSPLVYLTIDDQMVIIGSAGGGPRHPSWYFNILADPEVTFERWHDGAIQTVEAKAVPVEGAERDRLWARVTALAKGFAAYQAKISRVIPVIVLQPH